MSRECSPRRPGPRCGSSLAGGVAAAWVAVVAGHQHPYPRYTPRVGTNPVFDVCNKDVIADMRERNERSGRRAVRMGAAAVPDLLPKIRSGADASPLHKSGAKIPRCIMRQLMQRLGAFGVFKKR